MAHKRSNSRNGERTDEALLHYAELSKETFDYADRLYPGTGAAGGMDLRFSLTQMRFLRAALRLSLKKQVSKTK